MKISQRGHSAFIEVPRSGRLAGGFFFCVGDQRVAEPRPLLVRLHASGQALAVTGAIALHDPEKLIPVDSAEVVVLTSLVPLEVLVRQAQTKILSLWHGLVDEALAQFVVG